MSAASSTTWDSASAGQPSWRSAAVVRGIGLVGVVKGFARSVLGLGLVLSAAAARLTAEGGDKYSANAGFDYRAVLSLLQRAVLMADALRARLRTPAVALALARFGSGRAFARAERPRTAAQPEPDVTLSEIACARKDERLRRQLRAMIEGRSDREVLTYIYGDLRRASAMLGDTDVAAEIRALACKASALLGDEADEVAADNGAAGKGASESAVTQPEAHDRPGDVPDPERMRGGRPSWRTVGRGPP